MSLDFEPVQLKMKLPAASLRRDIDPTTLDVQFIPSRGRWNATAYSQDLRMRVRGVGAGPLDAFTDITGRPADHFAWTPGPHSCDVCGDPEIDEVTSPKGSFGFVWRCYRHVRMVA